MLRCARNDDAVKGPWAVPRLSIRSDSLQERAKIQIRDVAHCDVVSNSPVVDLAPAVAMISETLVWLKRFEAASEGCFDCMIREVVFKCPPLCYADVKPDALTDLLESDTTLGRSSVSVWSLAIY